MAHVIDRPLSSIASLNQVHGRVVVRVDGETHRIIEADGLVTDKKSLTLEVRMADCQTLVFFSPKQDVIGALHVGWKGLIAGGIESMVETLQREWGIDPSDLVVGVGPSLCQQCAEFTDPARELPNIPKNFVDGRCVDLQKFADMTLEKLGVHPNHIERSRDCTRHNSGALWTYRGGDREQVLQGHTNALTIEMR
jgi:YfiH family protein